MAMTAHGISTVLWLLALFTAAVAIPAWRLIRSGNEAKKRRELRGGLIFLIVVVILCICTLLAREY